MGWEVYKWTKYVQEKYLCFFCFTKYIAPRAIRRQGAAHNFFAGKAAAQGHEEKIKQPAIALLPQTEDIEKLLQKIARK